MKKYHVKWDIRPNHTVMQVVHTSSREEALKLVIDSHQGYDYLAPRGDIQVIEITQGQ